MFADDVTRNRRQGQVIVRVLAVTLRRGPNDYLPLLYWRGALSQTGLATISRPPYTGLNRQWALHKPSSDYAWQGARQTEMALTLGASHVTKLSKSSTCTWP